MKEIFNEKCIYLVFALFLVTVGILIFSRCEFKESQKLVEEVEFIDSTNTYNKIFYDKEISSLRKENKELYDSLKKYKKDIDFLVQFKYRKSYETGVVHTNKGKNPSQQVSVAADADMADKVEARTYEYLSEPNDTFEYKLRINSDKEPNWYSLSANVKDKFTIVNKKKDDSNINHLTIESQGSGDISDVTAFSRKDKKKFKDRIAVGPGATAGYDPINKKWGMTVGVTVSFDLW